MVQALTLDPQCSEYLGCQMRERATGEPVGGIMCWHSQTGLAHSCQGVTLPPSAPPVPRTQCPLSAPDTELPLPRASNTSPHPPIPRWGPTSPNIHPLVPDPKGQEMPFFWDLSNGQRRKSGLKQAT